MKKEWWIIGVLILIILVLIIVIFMPKSLVNINFLNKSLNNSKNNVEVNNTTTAQICTSDSQCSDGRKCWYQVPTSLRQGISGSSSQPGFCVYGVENVQEDSNSFQSCTSNSQCLTGEKCIARTSANSCAIPSQEGSLENPGTCQVPAVCKCSNGVCPSGVNTNTVISCVNDSDCSSGMKCWNRGCGTYAICATPEEIAKGFECRPNV